MSLFSIIASLGQSTNSFSTTSLTSTVDATTTASDSLTAALDSITTKSGQTVTITSAAKIAAAAAADAKKDAATVATDTRAALDAQTGSSPDLSQMSPRALATIVLNDSSKFSATEVYAAKVEMKQRDRAAFLTATAGGLSVASLSDYSTSLATSRASMSAEERQVRANLHMS